MAYCINCGTKLADGVRFCTGCGTPIPSATAAEASPPQPETNVVEQTTQPSVAASAPSPEQARQQSAPAPSQPAPTCATPAQPTSASVPVRPPTPVYTAPAQPVPPTPAYAAPAQPAPPPTPFYAAPTGGQGETPPPAGSRYAPVSTGGFIGIFLLMLIPVVNFILLIVWACGGCRKVNQSNLAKAMLIMMLIGAALSVVVGLAMWLFFGSLGGLDGIKDSVMNEIMNSAAE